MRELGCKCIGCQGKWWLLQLIDDGSQNFFWHSICRCHHKSNLFGNILSFKPPSEIDSLCVGLEQNRLFHNTDALMAKDEAVTPGFFVKKQLLKRTYASSRNGTCGVVNHF